MSGPVTIGRIVHYRLSAADVESINFLRTARGSGPRGNTVHEGDVYPATVVAVNGDESLRANLQVHLDGPDTYWVTSRTESPDGEPENAHWFWPPRVGG